jgi:hypothetical protein
LRGVHEAHLPVGLIDEPVPDEAYVLVAGVEDLADCLPDRLVGQCFHELRVEHRLAPVQQV